MVKAESENLLRNIFDAKILINDLFDSDESKILNLRLSNVQNIYDKNYLMKYASRKIAEENLYKLIRRK